MALACLRLGLERGSMHVLRLVFLFCPNWSSAVREVCVVSMQDLGLSALHPADGLRPWPLRPLRNSGGSAWQGHAAPNAAIFNAAIKAGSDEETRKLESQGALLASR